MSAVARRSAAPVSRARLSAGVRGIKDNGFSQQPWGFWKYVAKHLTLSQLLIICRVREETTFKPRPKDAPAPEEWETQETALARELGLTERTVRDVLEELGDGDDGPGVIQYRRCGRGVAVKVNLDRERLARLRCRNPRKLTRAAKVDEPDPVVDDEPPADAEPKVAKSVPARLVCPVGLECPVVSLVKIEGALTNAPPGVSAGVSQDGNRNSSSAFHGSETGTPVPLSARRTGTENRNSSSAFHGSETGTPVPLSAAAGNGNRNSSSAFEQLTSWSNSYALSTFRKILDNSLCAKIIAELGPAPVLAFTSLVESRVLHGGPIGFGLLPLIAHDARVAWEKGRALREQQLSAEAASSDAVVEDWRRKLKRPGLDDIELDLIRSACPELADDVDGYRFRPVRGG